MPEVNVVLIHLGSRDVELPMKNFLWLAGIIGKPRVFLASDLPYKSFLGLDESQHIPLGVNGAWKKVTQTPHSTNFRDGYWLHTIRRLAAISDAHSWIGDVPILHVENDMLLLPQFPFAELSIHKKLAWTKCAEPSDMPGLVFSPSITDSSWLADQVLRELDSDPTQTDMLVLRSIGTKHPERVSYLFNGGNSGPNALRVRAGNLDAIFDPLAFGAYLFGTDPRNEWGISHLGRDYPPSTIPKPSLFSFHYSEEEGLVAKSMQSQSLYRIVNLHIHSKESEVFSPLRHVTRLSQSVLQARYHRHRRRFALWGFVGSLKQLITAAKNKVFGSG